MSTAGDNSTDAPKKKRNTRTSSSEADRRAQKIASMLSRGAPRSTIIQYASEHWEVTVRTTDAYIARARKILKEDWINVSREQMLAEVLSQYASLQIEARRSGQLHVALGAIHGAARVAQLIS